MTDAIIKFPKPARDLPDSKPAVNELETIFAQKPPNNGTDTYQTMQVHSVTTKLKSKHDFANARERNPHLGAMLSFSIIPGLGEAPLGPLMLPTSPGQLITGDTLKDIRERIIFEIDKAIQIAELAERDPEKYEALEKALLQKIAQGAVGQESSD